jgi:hypothetical protein
MNKLNKVTNVVFGFGGLSKFEAAEVAEKILARHGGNLKSALEDAANPHTVFGKKVW